jgi:hypothetical protein
MASRQRGGLGGGHSGLAVVVCAWLEISFLRVASTMASCMQDTPLVVETQTAFKALKLPPLPAIAVRRWIMTEVSLAELEATGKLSAQTKYWLRNAALRIQVMRRKADESDLEHYRQKRPIDPAATDFVLYYAVAVFPGGDGESVRLREDFVPP